MRPITGDCSCGGFFVQPKRGRRLYCNECSETRKRECNKKCCRAWRAANPEHSKKLAVEQYVRTRKNNPQWRALNKKRAKAWRAANRDHIRAYNEARA